MRLALPIFGLLALLYSGESHAFCAEPRPPSAPWHDPPTAPICSGYGSLSDCDSWEIESFRNEVQDFIYEMQNYADEAARFYSNAVDYANCQAEEALDNWNAFASR